MKIAKLLAGSRARSCRRRKRRSSRHERARPDVGSWKPGWTIAYGDSARLYVEVVKCDSASSNSSRPYPGADQTSGISLPICCLIEPVALQLDSDEQAFRDGPGLAPDMVGRLRQPFRRSRSVSRNRSSQRWKWRRPSPSIATCLRIGLPVNSPLLCSTERQKRFICSRWAGQSAMRSAKIGPEQFVIADAGIEVVDEGRDVSRVDARSTAASSSLA